MWKIENSIQKVRKIIILNHAKYVCKNENEKLKKIFFLNLNVKKIDQKCCNCFEIEHSESDFYSSEIVSFF